MNYRPWFRQWSIPLASAIARGCGTDALAPNLLNENRMTTGLVLPSQDLSTESVEQPVELEAFRILIVDEDAALGSRLAQALADDPPYVAETASASQVLKDFHLDSFHLAVIGASLRDRKSGRGLAKQILQHFPQIAVMVIAAQEDFERAVEAMDCGALGIIPKPLQVNFTRHQVRHARRFLQMGRENRSLRCQLSHLGQAPAVTGNSRAMQNLLPRLPRIAASNASVLIHGESGSGKKLIARMLHDLSDRNARPFLAFTPGSLPDTLVEKELFGANVDGGGRTCQYPGSLELAGGGSLLIDEVSDLSANCKIRLLRVLSSGKFSRLGSDELIETNTRVLMTTRRSMGELVDQDFFWDELFHGGQFLSLEVPPLRHRGEDIPLLVQHFLSFFCLRHDCGQKRMTPEATQAFVGGAWPGNVRQLKNPIERIVLTYEGTVIDHDALPVELKPDAFDGKSPLPSLAKVVECCERETIARALKECGMHREKTAKALGISVRTLHYKMERYGLR